MKLQNCRFVILVCVWDVVECKYLMLKDILKFDNIFLKNYIKFVYNVQLFLIMFYGVFFGNGVCVFCIDEMIEFYIYVENKCQF